MILLTLNKKWEMIKVKMQELFNNHIQKQKAPVCISQYTVWAFLNLTQTISLVTPNLRGPYKPKSIKLQALIIKENQLQ